MCARGKGGGGLVWLLCDGAGREGMRVSVVAWCDGALRSIGFGSSAAVRAFATVSATWAGVMSCGFVRI